MEGPVEVGAGADACRLDGFDSIEHLARTDAETGAAQHAGEMDDVFRQAAMILRRASGHQSAARAAILISSRMRAASLPETRAMSS